MRKILLVRTDRIGDVVLTTPAIELVRNHYPNAHIAFLTTPLTGDLIQGNPYIDELIIYDKNKLSFWNTFRFAQDLKKKKFNVAIAFNPKFRFHLLLYLSGISKRIGYQRKGHFFLTDTVTDLKYEGKKSEAFYNEDLLSLIGIPPQHSRALTIPESAKTQDRVNQFLLKNNIKGPFIVMNLSASCPSKTWPIDNFVLLSNNIYQETHLPIIAIGHRTTCDSLSSRSQACIIPVGESFSLPELAALFKKSLLHITNDTGPMHIAAAMSTPIISIFGRNAPGLGPNRWAPFQENSAILHKNIGCNPCLAHHCKIEFDCLKAIKVEDVTHEVRKKLKNITY